VTGLLRLVLRVLVTWAIEAAVLFLMLRYLPGVIVERWTNAVAAVLAIGLLNALVRPVILLGAANLGVIPFLLVALLLNAALIWVAAWIVPGFAVDGLGTAFLVAVGLAGLNALLTAMLSINDDDSFYRNVTRRLARRLAPAEGLDRPGTVIVQIDGLAEPILRRALGEGRMPTLAAWLASGSHHLIDWECDVPSMTTSSQAGILHGRNDDIPAFYWYEKRDRKLMSSANPRDLNSVQRWLSDGRGLLHEDGVSVTNLLSGDAGRAIMTVGTLRGEHGELEHRFEDLLAAGVEVWQHPVLPHAKVVLADERVLVGTTNLDAWALYRNWEVGLLLDDAGVAETVRRELFDPDVAASRPARPPTNPLVRARNWLLALISPLL
jgi:uncharacterized membrane protein YvlD (DUF360 family)